METKEQGLSIIKSLGHGDSCNLAWNEDENKGSIVYRLWDNYLLFDAPARKPAVFVQSYNQSELEYLVDLIYLWN